MKIKTRVILFLIAPLVGCAVPQTNSNVIRLQSHIEVLEQKIAQMERMESAQKLAEQTPEQPQVLEVPSQSQPESLPPRMTSAPERATASVPYLPEEDDAAMELAYTPPSTDAVQKALQDAGFYEGNVDGEMGPITRGAVREFQRIHGLEVDGVIGYQTWKKLKSYTQITTE